VSSEVVRAEAERAEVEVAAPRTAGARWAVERMAPAELAAVLERSAAELVVAARLAERVAAVEPGSRAARRRRSRPGPCCAR